MSLRRTLLTVVLASTALLSACTLRSRYRELVQATPEAISPGQMVVLRVLDPDTNQPVPGAKVLAGERRERLSAISDDAGMVTLNVSKELLDENPLVEVVLPKGVRGYRLQLVPSGQAPAPEAAPAAPAMPETPATPETPASPESPATTEQGGSDAGT